MPTLQFITNIHFGHGERSVLPSELRKAGSARPLFVTDRGVVAAGVFALAAEAVADAQRYPVFDDTPINPTEEAASRGAKLYREQACDAVVGIGGGASLDLAKAVAVLATHEPPLWDYSNRKSQPKRVGRVPPVILLPTTAGTGSEVGRAAVILFDNGVKAGVRCPDIVTAAICDPDLTMGLPPLITATTGMDALSHCIETFCSTAVNPPADAIARDGMRRIFKYLVPAVREGAAHREARWNMMMGSLEGAICFQKGLGAVHALAHPLGALGHHHGTLNAILLPHVLDANRAWLGDKTTIICQEAGMTGDDGLAQMLTELNATIGIPPRLRDLGIDAAVLDGVAELALEDNAHKTNPRPMEKADYLEVLRSAY